MIPKRKTQSIKLLKVDLQNLDNGHEVSWDSYPEMTRTTTDGIVTNLDRTVSQIPTVSQSARVPYSTK